MTQTLSFNDVSLVPFPAKNDSQIWLRSADIARALGYKRPDILSKLYNNNADEFTPDMTQVVEIVDNTVSVGTGNLTEVVPIVRTANSALLASCFTGGSLD